MELVKEKTFTNERPHRNSVTTAVWLALVKLKKRQDLKGEPISFFFSIAFWCSDLHWGFSVWKFVLSSRPPPLTFFLVGLMGRDFVSLQALSLCSLALTGSCTDVLKPVLWWTVMHKGFAVPNEIKPAPPAWYVPAANVLNQKEKKKAVMNFLTDCFQGIQMLIHQKPIYPGNKSLSRRSSSERFFFFFFQERYLTETNLEDWKTKHYFA